MKKKRELLSFKQRLFASFAIYGIVLVLIALFTVFRVTQINTQEHKTAGKITASFGVTQYKQGDTLSTIFKRCDDALYKAKENGRNRVEAL